MSTRSRYENQPPTNEKRAEFLPYIHNFRAIAIIAVVASHLDLTWPSDSVTGRFVLATVQDASAMFLFVAGFLFQHLSAGFRYGKYLKSKLVNVIIPYVVVSLPELVYQYWDRIEIFAPGLAGRPQNPWLNALYGLLTAAHIPAPMWFIPMISILYLAAPLLVAIDRRPRLYWLIVPSLIVAMLCHRPMPVNQTLQALIYFSPAYLTGMWFSHYREQLMKVIDARLGLLFAIYASIEMFDVLVLGRTGVIYSRHPFSIEHGILDLNLPNKLLLSFALVGLLARLQDRIGERMGKRLDHLAGASFGVFFVHDYFLNLVERLTLRWHHRDLEGNLLVVIVLVTVVTIASLGAIAVVRSVAGKRSRYIVGC